MELINSMRQGEGTASIDDLASKFNLSRAEAEAVVANVAPQLAARIERNTLSRGGLADLVTMMGELQNHGQMLGAAAIGSDRGRDFGNEILQQVLVNKDASRAIAARAYGSTGIAETLIKAMLPYIATMVLGSLARGASGGLGDILSKLPQLGGAGGSPTRPSQTGSGGSGSGFPFPAPSASPGGSTSGGPFGGGSMLPGPDAMSPPGRTSNPYGDLSDVIRRGGGNIGGNPLWSIVRNVLGGLLGFRSSGIVSWLIRMVVLRYGWSIARAIFGRMLFGR